MGKIHLVTCEAGAEKVVKHIMLGEPIIGLACTGVNVGPKGQLSLVVLSNSEGDVFTFDVKKHPDIMYEGLGRLLQSVHVLKVVHGSGPVAANLHTQFGINLQNIFDTQVAYSVVLEKQGLCPRKVTLSSLWDKCGIHQYTPSPEFQKLLAEDMHAWVRRPLTRDMLNTAASYALPLVPTLYKQLLGTIEKDCWDWFCVLNDKERLSLLHPKKSSKLRQKALNQSTAASGSQLPVIKLTMTQRALLKNTVPPAAQC
ncbi:piRNA biogenesis protein EXD1-like [Littorina saxatilis]|uniref:3'-5' exonuclease domain-containing protein n=1 Tax=Littorina saxatilis TaxID=31220 RepID=A0AAN9C294_9CAEN